jgi:hypothetical protein
MNVSRKYPSRRMLGLWVGAGLGFLYSLIAATINLIFIHDVPLYISPELILNQIFWATVAAGLMGFIVNWPEAGFLGVLAASFLGGITIFLETLLRAVQAYGSFGLVLVTFVYMILPMAALFIPLTALLRWAGGYFLQIADQPWWVWRSLRVYLFLIAIAVILGSMPLYSSEARSSLRKMDAMIKHVQDFGPDDASWAFRTVAETVSQADDNYSLEWTDDLRRFPYSLVEEGSYSSATLQVVLAYFDSGETIACLFGSDATLNLCAQAK